MEVLDDPETRAQKSNYINLNQIRNLLPKLKLTFLLRFSFLKLDWRVITEIEIKSGTCCRSWNLLSLEVWWSTMVALWHSGEVPEDIVLQSVASWNMISCCGTLPCTMNNWWQWFPEKILKYMQMNIIEIHLNERIIYRKFNFRRLLHTAPESQRIW